MTSARTKSGRPEASCTCRWGCRAREAKRSGGCRAPRQRLLPVRYQCPSYRDRAGGPRRPTTTTSRRCRCSTSKTRTRTTMRISHRRASRCSPNKRRNDNRHDTVSKPFVPFLILNIAMTSRKNCRHTYTHHRHIHIYKYFLIWLWYIMIMYAVS